MQHMAKSLPPCKHPHTCSMTWQRPDSASKKYFIKKNAFLLEIAKKAVSLHSLNETIQHKALERWVSG